MKGIDVRIDKIEHVIGFLTDLRILKWEEIVGEKIARSDGRIIQCYKTTIEDFAIKTSAKTTVKHSWWSGDKTEEVFGLVIEKDGHRSVLTTNHKVIPGIEIDAPRFIEWIVKSISEYMLEKCYEKENMPEKKRRNLLELLEEVTKHSNNGEQVNIKKIVVLDLMETIMSGGGTYPVVKRDGLDEFLERYAADCIFVVATDLGSEITKDESIREVERYLTELGIKEKISRIYYGWDMTDGHKDLDRIAMDFSAELNDVIFIGDGDKDEKSARLFEARFIKVPPIFEDIMKISDPIVPETYKKDYENAPNKFSFKNLRI